MFMFNGHLCSTSGGAGGKGTWGKLTDMYDEEGLPRDAGDPNYDSVEEEVRLIEHSGRVFGFGLTIRQFTFIM